MRYRPDGHVVVAGAHMDAIVWRAATGAIELLSTPGTFLAVTQDIDHVNVDIEWKIDPGDVVVLLTDGVTEAEDAHRHPFGYERVMQLVQRHARDPAEVLRDAVFAAVSEHSPELADDATVLVLRRMPT